MLRSSLRTLVYRTNDSIRSGGGRGHASRHNTGPVYFKRKNFKWGHHQHGMYARIGTLPSQQHDRQGRLWKNYRHMPGDVQRKPDFDFRFNPREDGVISAWRPRGRVQLFLKDKTEFFACFYCGYPIKSALVAVKEDNWDYRMCYRCYTGVCAENIEDVI